MASTDAHGGAEVLEDAAPGKIKTLYDDIKATFRVPIVNLVFRQLAAYPDYLSLAWRQLQPNAQIQYFESRADAIRVRAVERVHLLGQGPAVTDPAIVETLRVFHYANPKLLVAVAALRAATNGQYPKLGELSTEDKRRIPSGIPVDAPTITMVDQASATTGIAGIFSEIQAMVGPGVLNSDYRALAQWPDYLNAAWNTLKPNMGTADFRRIEQDLRLMAEEAILLLPFRIEINPHTLRLCGMSEAEIDEVRALLERFYRVLPGLIANISFLTSGSLGRDIALRSPYPVTTTAAG